MSDDTKTYIKNNLDKYEEYYMLVTCQKTGVKTYFIITNLYRDPYYFIDMKGDYSNGFYLLTKQKTFFKKFKKHKMLFVNIDNSLGLDRVIYKRVNK